MKTTIRTLRLLILFSCSLITTAVFGQVTQIWTGTGTNIVTATNWGGTAPNPNNGDTGEFNGVQAGPISVFYNTGWGGNPGGPGLNLYLAPGQTSPVTIQSSVAASANLSLTSITNDPGTGTLTLGGTDPSLVLFLIGRPNGAVHPFVNNSTNATIITGNVGWTGGGGANWTMDFSGTGDWIANNYLVQNNGPGMLIQQDGPGTLFWTPGGFLGANGLVSITVNGGKIVLKGPHPRLNNQAINLNGGVFEFDAPAQSIAISSAISGTGILQVNNGTITLAGSSSYSGSNVLTGGELIVNRLENQGGGTGPIGTGPIVFLGGTLGFSVNNSFDYSSRFDTVANQSYSFDTGGQLVTFGTGLSSVGGTLTKVGSGTLTLSGPSTYTGLTTVNVGKLVFQGSKSGTGNITVADGAALGVTEGASQVTPATLTVGTVAGATLEFNNVNNTTTAPLAAGTIAAAGTITININSGTFNTIGQSFPLISWSSGSAPAVVLGNISGAAGNLTTNGNTIQLNITATPFVWTGANNNTWDLVTGNNWLQSGSAIVFANGAIAVLDDSAITPNLNINLSGVIQPASVTVNSTTNVYSILSSAGNDISGAGGLTKIGNSVLTLSGGANAYTGATTIGAGTVSVSTLANGGVASDIGASSSNASSLVLNGGVLQYTGPGATIDRLFTLGSAGGSIDSSGSAALALTNTGTIAIGGSGPRTFTLAGTVTDTNTFAGKLIDSSGGPTSLAKSGVGLWVITGNNAYSGSTLIEAGILQVGAGGSSGTLGSGNIVDNASLVYNTTANVTNSVISGSGTLEVGGGGTVFLTGNSTLSGRTTIDTNGTLQLGIGGATGSLNGNSPITDNGVLIYNSSSLFNLAAFGGISGSGNVIVRKGFFESIGGNTYTGWTQIDPGATFQPFYGNQSSLQSSVITNNGTLFFSRQDNGVAFVSNNIVGTGKLVKDNNNQNTGDVTLANTNTYTGNTWIAGGGIVLGDGATTNLGTILGSVIFTNTSTANFNNRYLTLNRPDDFTLSNNIIGAVTDASTAGNSGSLIKSNANIVTITGNNTYVGGTIIGAGTLVVGNGGSTGTIGTGGVANEGSLVFNRTGTLTVGGVISGTVGTVAQVGPGTVILNGSNTMTGSMAVSNGTLVVNATGGELDVAGGTLAVGSITIPTNLVVNGPMYINAGTILVTLNKSLTQSNSFITANGGYSYTGGSMRFTNSGPSLAVGDKFVIFNQPVTGAGAMPIISPNFTVQNNLAVDGSVTVTSIIQPPAPTIQQVSVSGTNIVITATNNAGNTGGTYALLATNNLTAPLSTWPVVASGTFNASGLLSLTNPIAPGSTNRMFFILRAP